MDAPLVYADFHNFDDLTRLKLDRNGTAVDLARQNIQLHEGMTLTLYMDDADEEGRPDRLLVEGSVQRNQEENCWVAAIDWDSIRHESDSKSDGSIERAAEGVAGWAADQRTTKP